MLTVFVDFHHAGLLQSLILLFEKRLGGQVYRPIGIEWAEQGFWKIYDHPATQAQYLGIGSATPDGSAKLNEVIHSPKYKSGFSGGWIDAYLCHDIDSGQTNKAITLETFMNAKIDIVIASIPAHVEPFKELCRIHPNNPKLIFQIGNSWTNEAANAPNIMASAIIHNIPTSTNYIQYHQEFDTRIFSNTEPTQSKKMASYINCFDSLGHFANDYNIFRKCEQLLPDWEMKIHGGQCRDGAVGPSKVLAESMKSQRYIWHVKNGGDGYGHIIHTAAALGKPLIVNKSYYADKLADVLLEDGVSCIDIAGLDPTQIVTKILAHDTEPTYSTMCKNIADKFKQNVDFDKEERALRHFLQNLR